MATLFRQLKTYLRRVDFRLLLPALASSCYGLVLVLAATATSTRTFSRSFFVQSIALVIGILAMIVVSLLDMDLLTDLWPALYALAVGAIVITILFGRGPTGDSNRNWIYLGPVSIQPTEFVKLAYILILAKALDRVKENINSLYSLLYVGAIAGGILLLMAIQGDMGTTLVFLFITVLMLFCAGLDWKFFAAGILGVLLIAPYAWEHVLSGYMRSRILYGFRPDLDPEVYGFQALQSKIAIGSGQFFGKGFLKGTQISLLPARQTDFLFATAGEEFGFLGSVLVLVLLVLLLLRLLQCAIGARTDIGTLICMGVFGMFFGQIFENIGMCLAMLPVVGITLPFFSYGGSSMISSWLAIGLVLAVYWQSETTLSFDA
ncbi:MAG: rod shape-determining protein RodA [Clostridia bacterium]|nr:rod shape-determining protein RodA [Clostridia bacterium]MBQ6000700.1 rod shape-determining protein RodA [Clostridia bacterium]